MDERGRLMDLAQAAIGDGITRTTSTRDPDLVYGNTQDLDIQVGVRKDPDHADQVFEHVVQGASARAVSRGDVRALRTGPPDDPPPERDRLDDPDAVVGEQSLQLPPERTQGPRLDLDQPPRVVHRVDPKSPDHDLETPIPAGRVLLLQRSM